MASVESIPTVNNESEMEEGEIVDDLDDLSDISSEEEFLLRQRLQVLENYNNVLERKKAKRDSILPGKGKNEHIIEMQSYDLSEISANELEDNIQKDNLKCRKTEPFKKISHKHKKINTHSGHGKNREHKKKIHHKRKLEVKVISESSEESDDEYRNKRRKLANAVSLNNVKSDTSTLKVRLEKMMRKSTEGECLDIVNKEINGEENKEAINDPKDAEDNSPEIIQEFIHQDNDGELVNVELKDDVSDSQNQLSKQDKEVQVSYELIDLCSEDTSNLEVTENDVVDSSNKENVEEQDIKNKINKEDSDDDLEILRQHALKTKNIKPKLDKVKESSVEKIKPVSDADDSDTSELRLICLKSAILKKAIEMKLKKKLRKRQKSKSITAQDDRSLEQEALKDLSDIENNTDIESVDMDIGSDMDEKIKESSDNSVINSAQKPVINPNSISSNIENSNIDDELEEDEDLLRAKLLTSLSKNLPNLVKMEILNTIDNEKSLNESLDKPKQAVPEEKKFIINLQDSDSEAEHEATKNLTKMHMKLSEQVDFQQKLDIFLKSARMQVENTKLPDVVQQPTVPKPPVKYVAKAVNHLPKSEQIEYKNLVRRMAELEKIKQARQTTMNAQNNSSVHKDTLKPRNITVNTNNLVSTSNVQEKIALSRKNIAEESAKMLKLKEEGTKLSQKYKIVATELRNISTAITLNKKEQRTVHNKLSRIRIQHQMLLKSSNFKHSTGAPPPMNEANNKTVVSRLQKENHPAKGDHKISTMLKAVTVSVVNNLSKENSEPSPKISVQVDVSSNKKIVKIPKSPDKERTVNIIDERSDINTGSGTITCKELDTCDIKDNDHLVEEKDKSMTGCENKDMNDYQSPLQAFGKTAWEEDPNAVLCPYEVGGSCRDPGCKFLHPKPPKCQ